MAADRAVRIVFVGIAERIKLVGTLGVVVMMGSAVAVAILGRLGLDRRAKDSKRQDCTQ
jgi:hypothetical protein